MENLRVLIVCENASDLFGGEAILPLRYFQLLNARNIDTYLITHGRVKESLCQIPGLDKDKIFYIPDHWLFKLLIRLNKVIPTRAETLSYGSLMWFISSLYQWNIARKIIKLKKIQVIHQPNPVSTKVPSTMFGLGVPVIIGPMNGGMNYPPAFKHMLTPLERFLYQLLRFMAHFLNIITPGKLLADVLLVANERSKLALPKLYLGQVKMLVENGVLSITRRKRIIKNERVELLFIGRMVDWKALDILLEALHQCDQNAIHLNVIGDGPEHRSMQLLAQRLDLKNVTFLGHVPFKKLNHYYDLADIFVLPSLRECGGAVVLEAMSRGLPVIATNWGGPADYLTDEVGYLVEPKSRNYMIDTFRQHIITLANDSELRARMGEAAIEHIKNNFLWEDKVNQMVEIYRQVIQAREH